MPTSFSKVKRGKNKHKEWQNKWHVMVSEATTDHNYKEKFLLAIGPRSPESQSNTPPTELPWRPGGSALLQDTQRNEESEK